MELEDPERELMAMYAPRGARTVDDAERMARADLVELEETLLEVNILQRLAEVLESYGGEDTSVEDLVIAYDRAAGAEARIRLALAVAAEVMEQQRARD